MSIIHPLFNDPAVRDITIYRHGHAVGRRGKTWQARHGMAGRGLVCHGSARIGEAGNESHCQELIEKMSIHLYYNKKGRLKAAHHFVSDHPERMAYRYSIHDDGSISTSIGGATLNMTPEQAQSLAGQLTEALRELDALPVAVAS